MTGYHCIRCGVCRRAYPTYEEARACALSDHRTKEGEQMSLMAEVGT